MAYVRLPESVQTLYAELLDQLRGADAEAAFAGVKGTFVSKKIRGRIYWYAQQSQGAEKRQFYLGLESPELRARIDAAANAPRAADVRRRRELVTMLEAGRMFREPAAIGVVLRVLADAGVFSAGGVLVGTQAFTCIANLLGVSFEKESLRTAELDVAHDTSIPLGLMEPPDIEMLERLRARDPGFFALPGIDSREPSTSFKVRGRDLRVDFLTPAGRHSQSGRPVYLPHLRVAAQPLAGLDYVIDANVDAAAVVGGGVRVNVPSPARFAFHKLWVSAERSAAETAKARKDIRQAEQVLDVLLDDRPGDLLSAWSALQARGGMLRKTRAALKKVDASIRARLAATIPGAA